VILVLALCKQGATQLSEATRTIAIPFNLRKVSRHDYQTEQMWSGASGRLRWTAHRAIAYLLGEASAHYAAREIGSFGTTANWRHQRTYEPGRDGWRLVSQGLIHDADRILARVKYRPRGRHRPPRRPARVRTM
jgi:hypothetical protein